MLPKHKNALDAGVRHVLLVLSTFADENGGDCFPSLRRLAEATALSRNTVTKRLSMAQAKGWIATRENRGFGFGKNGRRGKGWKRSEYTLLIPDHVIPLEPTVEQEPDCGAYQNDGGSPVSGIIDCVLSENGASSADIQLHRRLRKVIA